MTAWALVAVVALLLAERVWHQRVEVRERRRLVDVIVARTPYELAHLDRTADKPATSSANGEAKRPMMPHGV